MILLTALSLLRFGLYAPAETPPFQAFWFYGSVQVYEQKVKNPLGAEIGISPEFRKASNDFDGMSGNKYIIKPAYFLGITKKINLDMNAALGVKYGEKVLPYVGLTLRFDSIIKASQQHNQESEYELHWR
jgi:hypothetical protein